MKWLLIIVAATQAGVDYPLPYEMPRGTLASQFNTFIAQLPAFRAINSGVPFDSQSECRRAIFQLQTRAPDPETSPDDGLTLRALCKPIR